MRGEAVAQVRSQMQAVLFGLVPAGVRRVRCVTWSQLFERGVVAKMFHVGLGEWTFKNSNKMLQGQAST